MTLLAVEDLTVTIDTTPPVVTVTSLTTNDDTPALGGSIDDNNATISVTVSGQINGATNNGDGTWTLADDTLTALGETTHDVAVPATDVAGNIGSDVTIGELDIDTTPPAVPTASPGDADEDAGGEENPAEEEPAEEEDRQP